MGACTVTQRQDTSLGAYRVKVVDISGPASYDAGGSAITLASLGLKTVHAIVLCGAFGATALFHTLSVVNGATPLTDPKLMARDVGTGAEVTAATNLSTETVRAIVFGEGPFSN